MTGIPSKQELLRRTERLFKLLGRHEFDTALIIGKINQYYLTGTLQDGVLALKKNGDISFFVRKSYERARLESPMDFLRPMSGYRDMLGFLGANLGITLMETNLVPLIAINRLKKYFDIERINPLEGILSELRAVKSEFELELMRESGRQHKVLLEEIVPGLLREGMSEVDLLAGIFEKMLKLGHHGKSRFSMFQMEMPVGQIGFGENSIYRQTSTAPAVCSARAPPYRLSAAGSERLSRATWYLRTRDTGIWAITRTNRRCIRSSPRPRPRLLKFIERAWRYSGKSPSGLCPARYRRKYTIIYTRACPSACPGTLWDTAKALSS